MTKRTVPGSVMPSDKLVTALAPSPVEGPAQPQTRSELQAWVREHLGLTPALETSLLAAIDVVFTRHERLWQESKQDAIRALSAGFAEKMSDVASELSAKDATVSSISWDPLESTCRHASLSIL